MRSWKEKYWRPWCVARTAPLRCLVNLYQDFASYKLKEECAWLVRLLTTTRFFSYSNNTLWGDDYEALLSFGCLLACCMLHGNEHAVILLKPIYHCLAGVPVS